MKIRSVILFCFISTFLFGQSFIKQWDYRYGGSSYEYASNNIIKAFNGKLILIGSSTSFIGGDKSETNRGPAGTGDCWIVCLDSSGNKVWDKTIGGNRDDACNGGIVETGDHCFILCGHTNSDSSGDISYPNIDTIYHTDDGLVFKLDSNGNKIWDKRHGGTDEDGLGTIVNATGGGFLLGGYSSSGISGDKSDSCRGGMDFWIIKIDTSGNKIWDKTYGGSGDDWISKIVNTYDGGYLLAGSSYSGISGEKSQSNWDTTGATPDYWIVKIDSLGNKQWDKRFGGADIDDIYIDGCIQTADGGFLLSGNSYSPVSGDKTAPLLGIADYWVVKIDQSGNKLWDKKYGGYDEDEGGTISATSDGGFLIAGVSYSGIGADKTQANLTSPASWIVKADANGNKLWDKTLQLSGEVSDTYALEGDSVNSFYVLNSTVAGIGGDKSQDSRGDADYWISKWIYTPPSPVASFQSSDTVFCTNDCINFINLSTNATSWQWSFTGGNPDTSTAQNPQGICYASAGNYNVMLIASNSSVSDTLTINNYITVNQAPPPPTVNQIGNTLYCSTDPSYTSYQWFYDSTLIANATDTFYVATQSGNYNVKVENENGCTVGTGINVTVGIQDYATDNLISVSPNPASIQLAIHTSSFHNEVVTVSVMNVLGQEVLAPTTLLMGQGHVTIDINMLPAGVYFLQMKADSGSVVGRFVKE